MEENILVALPDFKLYNNRSIYIGTILGGPFVAGYFAAENFKRLGRPALAKKSWIIAVAATILLIAAVLFIPGIEKVPPYIIPLVYTGLAQYFIMQHQGEAIKSHLANGGKLYSAWRGLLIGLIGAAILVACLFILLSLNPNLTITGSGSTNAGA
ncbi:MAG TPA: hypothetical protein VGM30_09610 [Puia sp.]|jgi:4-amino-4-deoxy-L-arabinose transferase-like glycosyltransferase